MNPIRSAAALVVLAVLFTRPAGSIRPAVTSQTPAAPRAVPWADWVEPTFPFFSSVVDARQAAPAFPGDNLTPRALVLNLGRDHWVAFDTDLLRVSAAWRGKGLSARALAPGSYLHPDRKTPGGQVPAPEPEGTLWVANGIYPGWQIGAAVLAEDPRESAPSAEEIGRGPLPERFGRFKAVRLVRDGAVLEYTAAGADVREWMTVFQADGRPAESSIVRHFEVGPTRESLWLVVGHKSKEVEVSLGTRTGVPIVLDAVPAPKQGLAARDAGQGAGRIWVVKVLPHDTPINFSTAITYGASIPPTIAPHAIPTDAAAPRWPREITTKVTRSTSKDAYVVDDIELPVENPWRRNVRPGDVQFLKDGTGAVVTLDGDVWLVRGLHEAGGTARWRRFASGLHEPLTLAVRDEQLYVYDRNGIWRLRDTNGDGEADVHELFSNAFAQTADMREFPNTIRLAPDGEFVIAKGNQQAVTIGKHNGHVLRVSADGRRATSLGYGFRQPNIGVNIRTGLVTASDQQGHYIPTTPLHIVRDRQFYGFLSDKEPREQYPAPIADPLTWIPHATNASAMSQVWLFGARMGPLNDALVHIGFNKPELFRVMLNERSAKPQAAIVSITRAFDFPPNNGAVNPGDGQLYIAGFQILGWGTTASRLTGMGRVRYTGAVSTLPSEVVPMDKGILARFDAALDRQAATNPDNYSITSWQVQAHLSVRFATVQVRRHAGHRSAHTEQRLSLAGRPVRVHRRARDDARDADAARMVARHVRRHEVPGERVLHPIRSPAIRPARGGIRRCHRRSVAARRVGDRGHSGQHRGRAAALSALRMHGVSLDRRVGDPARPDVQGPVRRGAAIRERRPAHDRHRSIPARINPRAGVEGRRRLRARRIRHAELRRGAQ